MTPRAFPHDVISDWLLFDKAVHCVSHENEPEFDINFVTNM